jgi:hypothetical protein
MLGDSTLQNHIKNGYAVDVKPRLFLEFNGNDYGHPYFIGTNNHPSASFTEISLAPRAGSPAVTTVNRGFSIAMSNSDNAQLLKVTGSGNSTYSYFASATGSPVNAVKFNMFLRSDYSYQKTISAPVPLESFRVNITISGITSGGKIIRSEMVSETIEVNSTEWKPVTLSFVNPDERVTAVRINFYLDPDNGQTAALLVNKLSSQKVAPYEVFVKERLPLSEVFEMNRPGEFLLNIPAAERPVVTSGVDTFNQQCTPVHMSMSYALGPKYQNVMRSVSPFPGNPYSYYVSGSQPESRKIWSLYQNSFRANKIVIKANAIAIKPNASVIKVLTASGWSANLATGATFDNNGILTLYFDGQGWTTTAWEYNAYPKIGEYGSIAAGGITVNKLGVDYSGYQEIHGIYYEAATLTVVNSDFSGLTGSAPRLELIEVSPRLEVDVSPFIISTSIDKEISNDGVALPIGGISSNTMRATLSNIPIQVSTPDGLSGDMNDAIPISNISSTSPLKNLIRRGVKTRLLFDVDTLTRGIGAAAGKTTVPAFAGYLDSWSDDDFQINLTAFDGVKLLQAMQAAPLYLQRPKVSHAIQALFDSVGFGEFYARSLNRLRMLSAKPEDEVGVTPDETIPYFWTEKDATVSEVLADLCKVFQIGVYADEYGGCVFTSIYEYNKKFSVLVGSSVVDESSGTLKYSGSPQLYIQDYTDDNSVSNLESATLLERERPEKINIQYISPTPSLGKNARKKDQALGLTKKPFGRDKLWTLDEGTVVLPYVQIADPGITGAAQNYIPYHMDQQLSMMRAMDFEGMLLIDDEIVSYQGLEYIFTYKDRTGRTRGLKTNVNSPDQLDAIVSEIFTEKNGRDIVFHQSGRMVNVRRGLFGTPVGAHTRTDINSVKSWKLLKFTKTGDGYGSGTAQPRGEHWKETKNGISIKSNDPKELLFLYPKDDDDDDSAKVKNKKRLAAQLYLGDIPDKKDGYIGVGVGVNWDGSNKMTSGLLVWVGAESGKKKTEAHVIVQEVQSDGKIKTIISKNEFDYAENLIEEKENVEIFIAFDEERKQCKILVGGTSVFQKEKKKSEDERAKKTKRKKKIETYFDIRQIPKDSYFGVIAKDSGTGIMLQYQFGVSQDPEDLNDLEINDIDDDYMGRKAKRPGRTYYIGPNTLLDNIVNKQLIAGINDSSGDNFCYTGLPIARGIKLIEVDYDIYPVTDVPRYVWKGYTYDVAIFNDGDLVAGRVPEDIG